MTESEAEATFLVAFGVGAVTFMVTLGSCQLIGASASTTIGMCLILSPVSFVATIIVAIENYFSKEKDK